MGKSVGFGRDKYDFSFDIEMEVDCLGPKSCRRHSENLEKRLRNLNHSFAGTSHKGARKGGRKL